MEQRTDRTPLRSNPTKNDEEPLRYHPHLPPRRFSGRGGAGPLAEFHFFKGLAHLLAGMYFKTLPAEDNGPPVSSEIQWQMAVTDFDEALSLSTGGQKNVSYYLGKARASFYLGDKAGAVAAADAAIAADGNDDYVRYVKYDGINNDLLDDNTAQDALFERATDDLQPLPRLDFLDPKYTEFRKTGDDQDDIPMFKIEEAYLIKAQAQLADGDVGGARETMKRVVDVVSARPTFTLIDASEEHSNRNPGSRPGSTGWKIRRQPPGPVPRKPGIDAQQPERRDPGAGHLRHLGRRRDDRRRHHRGRSPRTADEF